MRKIVLALILLFVATTLPAFASDPFNNAKDVAMTVSATNVAAITPHDTNALAKVCRGVYVGVAGDIKTTLLESGTETFKNAPAGSLLPIRPVVVFSTGTTATSLLCLY